MAPGLRQNMSQMDGPLPSSAAAPSIWYADAAAPQTKLRGSSTGLFGDSEGLAAKVRAWAAEASPPAAQLTKRRRECVIGRQATRPAGPSQAPHAGGTDASEAEAGYNSAVSMRVMCKRR